MTSSAPRPTTPAPGSDPAAFDPAAALAGLADRTLGAPPRDITPMPGGASTRRFFRVEVARGRSLVGMYFPDASRPDEIAKTSEAGRRWPFLEVRELLAAHGVRVPRVEAEDCPAGLLLVEDLGDDTLANYLLRAPEAREGLYQAAVADLARAQAALSELPASSIVAQRAFDEDLLRWEVDHFREWGLEARGISLTAPQRAVFDEAASWLAQTIASWPRGFVHRDYQSRNLMVEERDGAPGLVWIDFQDALMGPRVYDLVALLNDSYQVFDRAFVEARLGEYAALRGVDPAAVVAEFDLVTVQRKLKDAGRFVFIDRVKHNPSFLRFVEPTLAKARASLRRVRGQGPLAELEGLLDDVLGKGGG